jgi:hypothetical protein
MQTFLFAVTGTEPWVESRPHAPATGEMANKYRIFSNIRRFVRARVIHDDTDNVQHVGPNLTTP